MEMKLDGTSVLKLENSAPPHYEKVKVQYQGNGGYPFADASIRNLMIRSCNIDLETN